MNICLFFKNKIMIKQGRKYRILQDIEEMFLSDEKLLDVWDGLKQRKRNKNAFSRNSFSAILCVENFNFI